MADELFPGGWIAGPQIGEGPDLLLWAERAGGNCPLPDGAPETEILWRKIAVRSAAHDIPPGT